MNLGRSCQIILKSDKEISGYSQLAQHAIFAYYIGYGKLTPLTALPPLRFPYCNTHTAHMFSQDPRGEGGGYFRTGMCLFMVSISILSGIFDEKVGPFSEFLCLMEVSKIRF